MTGKTYNTKKKKLLMDLTFSLSVLNNQVEYTRRVRQGKKVESLEIDTLMRSLGKLNTKELKALKHLVSEAGEAISYLAINLERKDLRDA